MADFTQLYLTTAGVKALLEAQAGQQLKFSKIKMGSGKLSGSSLSLRDLVTPVVSMPISRKVVDTKSNYLSIEAAMTNESVTEGFEWRELGLFMQDASGKDVLYAYANAGDEYDYVPAFSDQRYVKKVRLATTITDSPNISITVEQGQYVDAVTFDERLQEISGEVVAVDENIHQGYSVLEGNAAAGMAGNNGLEIGYIEGASGQVSTNGYQLFDASKLATKTASGATVTNNGDGSFTISGSGNLTDNFNVGAEIVLDKSRLKVGNIRLLCGAMTYPYCSVYIASSGGTLALSNRYGASETKELTEEILNGENFYMSISISGNSGDAIIPGTIKPMLYQDGDGTWEVFTGGKAAPCPEYPQEIKSFGDNPVNFYSHGFQLLKASRLISTEKGGATITNNGDGSFTIGGSGALTTDCGHASVLTSDEVKKLLKPGNISLNVAKTYPYFYVYFGNNAGQIMELSPSKNTFTLTQEHLDSAGFFVRVGFWGGNGADISGGTIKPMIYQDGEGEWEAYKEPQTTVVTFPAPLRSLPNGVHDTYENGIIVRRVGKVTIDGTTNKTTNISTHDGTFVTANYANSLIKKQPSDRTISVICDKLPGTHLHDTWNGDLLPSVAQANGGNYIQICLPNECGTTADEINAWLAANPVTVLYELAQPTTETVELPVIPSYALHTSVHHDCYIDAGAIKWHALIGGSGGSQIELPLPVQDGGWVVNEATTDENKAEMLAGLGKMGVYTSGNKPTASDVGAVAESELATAIQSLIDSGVIEVGAVKSVQSGIVAHGVSSTKYETKTFMLNKSYIYYHEISISTVSNINKCQVKITPFHYNDAGNNQLYIGALTSTNKLRVYYLADTTEGKSFYNERAYRWEVTEFA